MKHYAYEETFKMQDSVGDVYRLRIEQDDTPQDPREWYNVSKMVCWHRGYSLGDKHNYDNSDEFFDYILHNVCGLEYESFEEFSTREKYKFANESDKICIMELNLYDHSGITMSTSNSYPYNDRWDAGCVGFAYITKETAMEELHRYVLDKNGERIKIEHQHENRPSTWSYKTEQLTDDTWKERAVEVIEHEVEIYDTYLRNDVYGYVLEKEIKTYTCPHCDDGFTKNDLIDDGQINIFGKCFPKCPHCNGEIESLGDLDVVDTEYDEVDSCWGYYGDCLEENGILDELCHYEFID